MPDEQENAKEQLKEIAKEFQKNVSIEKMIEIGEKAEKLEGSSQGVQIIKCISSDEAPVIAVARDEAFCFYYEDNLRILQEYGAKLEYFSPIYDERLPEGCSGLLLGGGYPELYGEQLSGNTSMREAIKTAIACGMPVVAECGGFMYLHSKIIDKDKRSYQMAGVIPADCYYTGKSVRFGYIELRERKHNFLPEGEVIKGHEFHYYESEKSGENCLAIKPVTGKCYPCVISGENCFIGFLHLYYPSNPAFAERVVEKAKRYMKRS
jgi:cobyrinic acid a,c-diamide synthase